VPPPSSYPPPTGMSTYSAPLPAAHSSPFKSQFQQQPSAPPPSFGAPPPPILSYAGGGSQYQPPPLERESSEHIRNLQLNMAYPGETGAGGMGGGGGGEACTSPHKPFMQSLTSMHGGMSPTEVNIAERKRREWLMDLESQVKQKEERKAAERHEKEIEDLKEELRAQTMRASADAALQQQLQQTLGKK